MIRVRISFAKSNNHAACKGQKAVRPLGRVVDFNDKPTCTMPKPSIIIPTALIRPKIKFDRLLTTAIGSLAAKGCCRAKDHAAYQSGIHGKRLFAFLPIDSFWVALLWLFSFFLKKFHRVNPPYKLNISSKSSSDRSS